MANKKPTHSFPFGHKFGKGRPAIPEDLKAVRKLTAEEAERLITGFLSMPPTALVAMIKDSQTPAIHSLIANIILKGVQGGDAQRMEFLFNRTIGRVLDKIEVTSKPFVIRKADGVVVLGTKEIE